MSAGPSCPTDHGSELWQPTPQQPERYEVSSWGRVRNTRTGQVLRPWVSDRGYAYVDLSRQTRGVSVHRLVLDVFGPARPAGHDVDHIDWNRTHNCVRNLRWLGYLENHVRWAGRYSDGRIIWAGNHDSDEAPPCDHQPLTPEQEQALLDDLALAGWAA